MLSMLGCVLMSVVTVANVYCMMEHSGQYTEAAASPRIFDVVYVPKRVQQLKRVPKVVPKVVLSMPEHVPVDVSIMMRQSLFKRELRPKVTHIMPVQAVAATAFEGAFKMSTALVPVANHVHSKVTRHVLVPVETYTQWMLFMQSMSVVKPVEKTKPSAPPPACVCPRDDETHGNKTSSDVAVESTGAIIFRGVRFGCELVGAAFIVFVFVSLFTATGVGTE